MKLGVKVGDVMTRNFVYSKPDDSISVCAREIIRKKIGSLIIKEKDKLRGLLPHRSILKAIVEKQDISKLNASDLMIKRVATISPEKDLYDAIVLLNKKQVRQLPVVHKNKVIGMITFKDILRVEPTLLDTMYDLSEIKESMEKRRATGIKAYKERKALACGTTWIREGQCEECGEFDVLYNMEGDLVCEDCRDELLK